MPWGGCRRKPLRVTTMLAGLVPCMLPTNGIVLVNKIVESTVVNCVCAVLQLYCGSSKPIAVRDIPSVAVYVSGNSTNDCVVGVNTTQYARLVIKIPLGTVCMAL